MTLNDLSKYTALPYVLGKPGAVGPVTLNGRRFYITKNLAIALRNLQHENEGLVLWIDSIYINQQDNIEKAYQVQQIAKIYSGAAIVLVWLGCASNDSDVAMSKLEDLSYKHAEMEFGLSMLKSTVPKVKNQSIIDFITSLTVGVTIIWPSDSTSLELFLKGLPALAPRVDPVRGRLGSGCYLCLWRY